MAGIDFLTRTGQMCSEARQEFILLSDTLGASMLVDAINHRLPTGATATTVFGPFYTPPPAFADGDDISEGLTGTPLLITGSVRSASGKPLPDAIVDIWHCDADGFYDLQGPAGITSLSGRGRFCTQADGSFHLWTIRPTAYPIPTDGPVGEMLAAQGRHPFRPEHVHFLVEAPGHRKLVTHLFAQDDDWLFSDVVFGVKNSLIRHFERHEGGTAWGNRQMDGTWFSLRGDFQLAEALG
ncbi:dioxygenase family protein [Novosphingobium sp. Leaf2]|uniref:dioxygenase family protein n=1 Tax=Novosphingobium sp. Leaf2 TaxID=1735670 RepID=UPI001911024F|nr:dioxygenase [Novosphingobium sp. Leaf2]